MVVSIWLYQFSLSSAAVCNRAVAESLPSVSGGPETDSLQTFRVSDAVRRRKVDGARTRGPQTVAYGDLSLGRSWVR